MEAPSDPVEVLRPGRVARGWVLACCVGIVATAASIVAVSVSDDEYIAQAILAFVVTTAGCGFLVSRYVVRPRFELSDAGVRVVKAFSTHDLAWDDIRSVSAEYAGVTLHLRNGQSVVGSGSGKGPALLALGIRTADDRIADRIAERRPDAPSHEP